MEPVTYQQLGGAFTRRYQTARGIAWYMGAHVQALTDIARWCNAQAEIEKRPARDVAKKLLDQFFEDQYAQKQDYPPRLLAAQCGRYYAPPVIKLEDEPDHEAINLRRIQEHRKQSEWELLRKLELDSRNKVKPPPLEELVSRIGRKV